MQSCEHHVGMLQLKITAKLKILTNEFKADMRNEIIKAYEILHSSSNFKRILFFVNAIVHLIYSKHLKYIQPYIICFYLVSCNISVCR